MTQSHASAFTLPSSPFTLHFPPTNTLDFPRVPALARSLAAAYEVDGVEVDASTVEAPTESGFIEARGSGPWTHFREIEVGERSIKAVAPELRLATELSRGRKDRADLIAHWLHDHGHDAALLANALDAYGIAADARASVMAIITG